MMRGKEFSKKGVELSISLVILTIAGLIVLMLLFSQISKGASMFKKGTSCGSMGGVLTASCNGLVSQENAAFSNSKKSLKCCMKKIDAKEVDYDRWVASLNGGNSSDFDAITSSSGTVYGSGNYAVSPAEIPDYSGSELSFDEHVQSGEINFLVNDKTIHEGQTASVFPGKVAVSATNPYGKGECYLNIRHASGSHSDAHSLRQKVVPDCKKGDVLRFTYENLPALPKDEHYKVNFGVKKKGKDLGSGGVYLKTKDTSEESEPCADSSCSKYTKQDIKEKINIVTRDGQKIAFITPFVSGDSTDRVLNFKYASIEKGSSCPESSSDKYSSVDLSTNVNVPPSEDLCLVVSLKNNKDEYLVKLLSSLNSFKILDRDSYQLLFNDCPVQACNRYSNDKSKCVYYKNRETSCQYTRNCFWSKADASHSGKFCASCEDKKIKSCEDLRTKEACEQNDCLAFKCTWKKVNWLESVCVQA